MTKNKRWFLGAAAGLLLLGSCKAPELTTDERIVLPETYVGASADSTTVGDLSWENFIPDEILKGYIRTALANNHSFQQIMERVSIARSQVRLGKGALLPEVSIGIQAGVQRFGEYSMDGVGNSTTNTPDLPADKHIPDPYKDLTLGIGFQWEADIWGKLAQKKHAAAARWMASVEAANLARTILISDLSSLYFGLVGLDKQRTILNGAIEQTRASYELTYELKKEGEVNQLAVDQFQSRLLRLQGMLLENEQQIGETERAIATMMGAFPFEIRRITFDEMNQMEFPIQAGVPSQLLRLRPDVREAEMALLASKADLTVAHKAFFPSLVIGGGGGFNAFDLSHWFTAPASLVYNLAAGITAPIFKRNEIRVMWDNAKSEQRIALSRYHETALRAYEEVTNLVIACEQIKKRKQLKMEESQIHHRSISNANDLFKLSFVGYLEVLSADERYLDCELEYATLAAQNCATKMMLFRALGGGRF